MTSNNCLQTYQALRDNRCRRVPEECVEPLLHWLCGGRKGAAGAAYRILGSPFDDQMQVERVYRALDAALFREGELTTPEGDWDEQRDRYRLLIRTFHPDRFPHLSDWLGPRAQTINAAFAAFRKQEQAGGENALDRNHGRARPPAKQEAPFPDRIGLRERFINLCAPLARTRYLPQKILALTAILCALPLVYLYQQRSATEDYAYSWTAPVVSGETNPAKRQVADASTTNLSESSRETAAAQQTDDGGRKGSVQRAEAVMDRFRTSFDQGELQDLLALIAAHPRENGNTGRPWFRRSYGELFKQTRSRSLALDFSDRYADGSGVRLVGRYTMQIVYRDGRRASGSGPVQYRLIPQDGGWKISAIDYRRE